MCVCGCLSVDAFVSDAYRPTDVHKRDIVGGTACVHALFELESHGRVAAIGEERHMGCGLSETESGCICVW